MVAPQIVFPLVTSATATNPFMYTEESTFALRKTASPVYTGVPIAGDLTIRQDGVPINVPIAGQHTIYRAQSAGKNYTLSFPIHPLSIAFLKYGIEKPNYNTPAGNINTPLQFLYKYKQAMGTAQLHDAWLYFLGCRASTTTLTQNPQSLLEATMEFMIREIEVPALDTAPVTSPTYANFSDFSGPVFQDSDGGNLPLSINSVAYPTDNFSLTVAQGTFAKPYNGSGLADAILPGQYIATGTINIPIGQDLAQETAFAAANQTPVTMKYTFKTGVMVATCLNTILTANDRSVLTAPTEPMGNSFSFQSTEVTLGTT
jgi:hypothetical protein